MLRNGFAHMLEVCHKCTYCQELEFVVVLLGDCAQQVMVISVWCYSVDTPDWR